MLLNQEIIGGLGNIYVDESLAIARIHPERTGDSLGRDEINRLLAAINGVIDALSHQGTTFRDYRDSSGREGAHQHHLRVYGRKGEPCLCCGTAIIRTEVGGRGIISAPSASSREDGAPCIKSALPVASPSGKSSVSKILRA